MSLKYIPSVFLAVAVAIALGACGGKQQGMQAPPPVNVSVQTVSTADAAYYDEYPAIVRGVQEVELRPQVSGYITGIHFTEGSQVKKGQKLYSIDPQQSEASYSQAVAGLAVQEANLERAKRDVERYRELDKKDAIAKQQVDNAEATYAAAVKQVEAAKASVRAVQTNVRYTTIVAPFDGTIGISAVRLGASVSPGQTLLNTISSDDPIAVDIVIDQKELYRFSDLQAKNMTVKNDSTFKVSFGESVYPHPGKISIIDRAVDPQTGTIKVRLTFSNPDRVLRSGMSGTLIVESKVSKSVVIPYKAINEQLGEFFVYVADSAKATQVKVKLGKAVGKNIIIKEGLSEGDVIITEGIQNLREGTPINIAAPNASAPAPVANKK
ncbi:efflux RND transporter periplasmic adaptor subunit [Pseudochryseolinea flava]|uniref:Efflux RND transporter periplasmic adaptor subunit n=1 Tax=Pseudochryseolinea flava TaxID=2059302 RepID=A0A364XWZ3_9BACT|nr:efflux RND transporter periplasmic adaptor subunit [Pseudochryseolinea flava]RAV98493.1 efflux RND transporter periplasmic adaptor subunit [Pseudochryseolinea flava]